MLRREAQERAGRCAVWLWEGAAGACPYFWTLAQQGCASCSRRVLRVSLCSGYQPRPPVRPLHVVLPLGPMVLGLGARLLPPAPPGGGGGT